MPKTLIIKTITVALVIIFITGYAYSKTIDIIRGPEIIINTPTQGQIITNNLVTIKGQAVRIAKLYLNGKQIFTDDQGNFSESLLLAQGYSTLHLEASDIFNRISTQDIAVTYQPKP